jgi:hypothetical protein
VAEQPGDGSGGENAAEQAEAEAPARTRWSHGNLRPAVAAYITGHPEVLADPRHAASKIAAALGASDEAVRRLLTGRRPGRVYSAGYKPPPALLQDGPAGTAIMAGVPLTAPAELIVIPELTLGEGWQVACDRKGRIYAVKRLPPPAGGPV